MCVCPPILLIVFNRPQQTSQVIEAIRRRRPARLYVAADGPRSPSTHPNDRDRCEQTRRLVETIDWPCEVSTRFSETNQGCGRGVSSAISWFFEHEDSGIILEDDCLPADDFFSFCAKLLARYRDDPRVMHICGNNFGSPFIADACSGASYGFGKYAQVWGWASWARAWHCYQYDVEASVGNRDYFKVRGVDFLRQRAHQANIRATLGEGGLDTWDYQWQFAVLKNKGLCVAPSANLISNLGFGEDATHTTKADASAARVPHGELSFPLIHPKVTADAPAINRIYAEHMLGDARHHRKRFYKSWIRRLRGRTRASN